MSWEPTDSGVYLLVLEVPRPFCAAVGCLGRISLRAGRYGYVGSARRGLSARLSRHRRRKKPLRWHIDRVTAAADPVGAVVWPWQPGRECRLAEALQAASLGRLAASGFGSSDCRCPGHLFVLPDMGLGAVADTLSPLLDAGTSRVVLFPLGAADLRRKAAAVRPAG